MAYDRTLADRIHAVLTGTTGVTGKPMFGGYGVFRHGTMFAGVYRTGLMVKLGVAAADALLEPHTSGFDPMDTGKPMTGWVVIDPPGLATDAELKDWLDRALAATAMTAKAKKKPKK